MSDEVIAERLRGRKAWGRARPSTLERHNNVAALAADLREHGPGDLDHLDADEEEQA